MNAAERLLLKAQRKLEEHQQIPLDLYAQLIAEGVDVSTLERNT